MNTIDILFTGRRTTTRRWVSPFYSFNRAFRNRVGEIGLPIKTICELYGPKGIGKSTLAYSLAGRIAAELETNIVLADIEEHLDHPYLKDVLVPTGFGGSVHVAEGNTDTEMLEDLLAWFKNGANNIGILDSIGAISPIAEEEGNLSDQNMGRRAKLMSVFSKAAVHATRREAPSMIFATNHILPNLGSRGFTSSGGSVLKYMASTRIRLSKKEDFDDGSVWLCGKVDNNTFGFSGKSFYVFNLAGYGIHPGLTAVKDCVLLNLATESRTIKIGKKSYGFMKNMIANADDNDLFADFHQMLKELSLANNAIVETEKEEDTEEDEE